MTRMENKINKNFNIENTNIELRKHHKKKSK